MPDTALSSRNMTMNNADSALSHGGSQRERETITNTGGQGPSLVGFISLISLCFESLHLKQQVSIASLDSSTDLPTSSQPPGAMLQLRLCRGLYKE